MTTDSHISLDRLLAYSVNLVRRVQDRIQSRLRFQPEAALQRIPDPKKDPNNQPLRIDYYAEDYYGGGLEKKFKDKICAVGEETLAQRPDLQDISNRKEVFAIMDIIDGTDLVLRYLGNWCSAIVFFYPPNQEILLSIVADHEGNVFYATKQDERAYFYPKRCKSLQDAIPLGADNRPNSREDACIRFVRGRPSGPMKHAQLNDASVCFVGQKPPYFLAAVEKPRFCNKLRDLRSMLDNRVTPAPAFRLYNLGGIPMMPKVANGIMEAVIGLQHSKPHDIIAGAFIALKAGAFLGDLDGQPISHADLARWLNHPEQRCSPYILACTRELYDEILECVGSE